MALEVENVHKSFGKVAALRGISFSVAPGEIFGYLGPNGAGKTTTLRVIADLVRPDEGEVRLLGRNHREAASRSAIGFLPGELKLYGGMTAQQVLDRFARFRPDRPPVMRAQLLEALNVPPGVLRRRIKFLSHGTKQKIGIVIAMQHDPDLLLLDEASLGLDPLVQQALRELLSIFVGRGRAVLFSSHILSEVEAICERVAILRDGEIVALERVENLRRNMIRRLHVRFRGPAPAGLDSAPGVVRAESGANAVTLFIRGDVNAIVRQLAAHELEDLVFPEPELEDIFMSYYRDSSS